MKNSVYEAPVHNYIVCTDRGSWFMNLCDEYGIPYSPYHKADEYTNCSNKDSNLYCAFRCRATRADMVSLLSEFKGSDEEGVRTLVFKN